MTQDGVAVRSVTSVEAVLANGRHVHGVVRLGRGSPYAVWWVSYPEEDSATLVFRDAAGHVVTRLREFVQPQVINPLKHPVLLTPSDMRCGQSVQPPSRQVRVRQVMAGIKVWTYVQFVYPSQSGPVALDLCETAGVVGDATTYESDVSLPGGQLVQAVLLLGQTSTVSGIAAPGVASVTAVLPDGRTYAGTFVTGGDFPYQVWLVSYPTRYPATLVFRDAAGHQVAVQHAHANVWPVS